MALGRGQEGGRGVWRHGSVPTMCTFMHMHVHTCMYAHTHTPAHVYMYRNFKWPLTLRHPCLLCLACMWMYVYVCMCIVHGIATPHPTLIHPPATLPWEGTPGISKNSITLELIKIISFCLKICNLCRIPHPWVGVWFGEWVGGWKG